MRRGKSLTIRLSAEERAALAEKAQEWGMTYSETIRRMVLVHGAVHLPIIDGGINVWFDLRPRP